MTTTHRRILLTPAEMAALDDGQDWYEPGDVCWLGGYTDSRDGRAVALDLDVNGKTHDNWTFLHELPDPIRDRLLRSED